jgi:hypothetical protein
VPGSSIPPADGNFINSTIPTELVNEFFGLIGRTAKQGDRQAVLEHFKGYFCAAVGTTHVWSSNATWAETDLSNYMHDAANNAPLFIEAMVDACGTVQTLGDHFYAPDPAMINRVLANHQVGYEIRGDALVMREIAGTVINVPDPPPTMAENAAGILRQCLGRADQLLAEGRDREAVQEILWLLETVSTAFRGIDTTSGSVEGNYFNRIVRDLRRINRGTTLDRILNWIEVLHGFLSSPTGGGVRHGVDLNEGVALSSNEARLFCNLIRSYIAFLLSEHERLETAGHDAA